jgi:hypothetical protein
VERKGQVNQYNPYSGVSGPLRFTLNLAHGTTPFITFFDSKEYASNVYRLTHVPVVTHVWYRPGVEAFKELDHWTQDHVLNGGLLFGELNKAQTLADDPVVPEWQYEQFQEWCLAYYGRRLPPMEKPK